MYAKSLFWPTLCVGVLAVGGLTWGWGLSLSQSKEELDLEYEVSAVARDGSVSISLTISDLGKLDPLQAVVLSVPGDRGRFDVYVRMETRQVDGQLTARAQLSRELAERARIEIVPQSPPDGEQIRGWVWYPIRVRDHITEAE